MPKKQAFPDGRLPLATVYKLRYLVPGLLWVLYGVLNFFDDHSTALKLLSSAVMLGAVLCILFSLVCRQEVDDELSQEHLRKACTTVLAVLTFIIMLLSCVSAFLSSAMFDFSLLYPFLIGGILLSVGGAWLWEERLAFKE